MTAKLVQLRQKAQTGALGLVIACFVGSVLLRGAGVAPALAQQMAESEQPVMVSQTGGALCAPAEDPDILLMAIRERQQQLDNEASRIEIRLKLLETAEERIEIQTAKLIRAEEQLAATLAIADEAADRDIVQLTSVYENMKAKNAAEIFNAMDVNFAAGFLIRMNPQAAAEILSNMTTDAAYSVSLIMASRNIEAPTE